MSDDTVKFKLTIAIPLTTTIDPETAKVKIMAIDLSPAIDPEWTVVSDALAESPPEGTAARELHIKTPPSLVELFGIDIAKGIIANSLVYYLASSIPAAGPTYVIEIVEPS